jgi:hypothetical protein
MPSANWTVRVSDSASGLSPFSCSGDLSTSISGPTPDNSNPQVAEITLSNLSSASVTISWKTDEPATSVVNYGLTLDYGSVLTNNSLKTTHQLTLTGLSPDTGYHYGVASADAAGNQTIDDGYTFLTPVAPPTPTTPQIAPGSETVKPTVVISTILASSYRDAPTISGSASDNEALDRVEYSTDRGISWIKIDTAQGLGGRNVTFSFRPANLDDGNYQLLARAIDKVGNIGVSATQTLVIDRLPPLVGPSTVTFGPQILVPDSSGILRVLSGVDHRITVSAIGGPISIDLVASPVDSAQKLSQRFTMTRSQVTGLWTGILSFSEPGRYQIISQTIDGAGNKTERILGEVQAAEPSQVRRSGSFEAIGGAKVTLYQSEPVSGSWIIWEGSPYGQSNPQLTGPDGQFRFFAPAGKYYLEVNPPGHRGLISQIFTLTKPTPLTAGLTAQVLPTISIGGFSLTLPFPPEEFSFEFKDTPNQALDPLIDKSLPNFNLIDYNGRVVRSIDLIGKPTIITTLSTWSPTTAEVLPALIDLAKNKDLNVLTVTLLESTGRTRAFFEMGHYDLTPFVDRDGVLVKALGISSTPTHYFVSRSGIVKKVVVGVSSMEELTGYLSGL